MEPISIIYLMGGGQGFLLATILGLPRSASLANRILGLWIALFSLQLLFFSSFLNSQLVSIPHLMVITGSFSYLYGPFMLLYILLQTRWTRRRIPRSYWLHFIPFLLAILNSVPLLLQNGTIETQYLVELVTSAVVPYSYIISIILRITHALLYCLFSLLILESYIKNCRWRQKQLPPLRILFLRVFVLFQLLLWGMIIILGIRMAMGFGEYDIIRLSFLFGTIWASTIGYLTLSWPHEMDAPLMVTPLKEVQKKASVSVLEALPERQSSALESKSKYEKTKIKQEQVDEFKKKLLQHMEVAKPYLNPNLSLAELSEVLEIPLHHLSQVMNEHLNQNFQGFINHYRIEEVKQKLIAPENRDFTILGIAMECGFNSKSAFNQIFKKMTSMTPSQYRKKFTPA